MTTLQPRDAAGRARDFERLVLPHLEAAHNLAHWLTRSRGGAEDLVQTACLRALRFFDGFRGDNPRSWLLAIVRNAFYSSLRDARDSELAEATTDDRYAEEPPAPQPDPETMLLLAGDARLLREALGDLSAPLREALVLREMEGLSYREIAGVTGVPIGTVMSRLARARRQLQAALVARGISGGSR